MREPGALAKHLDAVTSHRSVSHHLLGGSLTTTASGWITGGTPHATACTDRVVRRRRELACLVAPTANLNAAANSIFLPGIRTRQCGPATQAFCGAEVIPPPSHDFMYPATTTTCIADPPRLWLAACYVAGPDVPDSLGTLLLTRRPYIASTALAKGSVLLAWTLALGGAAAATVQPTAYTIAVESQTIGCFACLLAAYALVAFA